MSDDNLLIIVAHRGHTSRFPENTLEAFEDAITLGVDFIECDIRETLDGYFVVYHDESIDGREVKTMTMNEIASIRVAGHFRIPTLQETLELCKNSKVGLFLEIKWLNSFQSFADILSAYKFSPDKVVIISFEKEILARMGQLLPNIKRGLILESPIPNIQAALENTTARFLGIECQQITKEFIQQVKEAGASIFVWNVQNKAAFEVARAMDIDGIIVDNPEQLRRWLS